MLQVSGNDQITRIRLVPPNSSTNLTLCRSSHYLPCTLLLSLPANALFWVPTASFSTMHSSTVLCGPQLIVCLRDCLMLRYCLQWKHLGARYLFCSSFDPLVSDDALVVVYIRLLSTAAAANAVANHCAVALNSHSLCWLTCL